MATNSARFWPLTGVLFGVLGLAGFASAPGAPAQSATGDAIQAFYRQHGAAARTADTLLALAACALVVYAGHLRATLRPTAEAVSAVMLAGAAILAAGSAAYFGFDFTLAGSAGDVGGPAAQALNALALGMYLPVAVGGLVFGLATGVAILRSDRLPRWTGYAAVVLGLVAGSPLGILGLAGLFLWAIVTGIVGSVRAQRRPTLGPAAVGLPEHAG